MIKNIYAWKISSLNEYSVQIRLGSNLGGFFISGRRRMPMAEKVDQMDPDERSSGQYQEIRNNNSGNSKTTKGRILRNHIRL